MRDRDRDRDQKSVMRPRPKTTRPRPITVRPRPRPNNGLETLTSLVFMYTTLVFPCVINMHSSRTHDSSLFSSGGRARTGRQAGADAKARQSLTAVLASERQPTAQVCRAYSIAVWSGNLGVRLALISGCWKFISLCDGDKKTYTM